MNQSTTKKDAIIFDIDGTLAENVKHMWKCRHGDNEWDKFYEKSIDDKAIEPTALIYQTFYNLGYTMLICTGRHEGWRPNTEKWLAKNNFNYEHLYMVPDTDWEPDHISKGKLADIIMKEYNILFVFDDKPSVVDMWRKKGVTVYQCDGDV